MHVVTNIVISCIYDILTIVFIEAVSVAAVMYAMKRGRVEYPLNNGELRNKFSVNPKLVQQIQLKMGVNR